MEKKLTQYKKGNFFIENRNYSSRRYKNNNVK